MRIAVVILVCTIALTGCASPKSATPDDVRSERAMLDELYPPGATRGAVLLDLGQPQKSIVMSPADPPTDLAEAEIFARVQRDLHKPAQTVDRYFIAPGIRNRAAYWDYLFYDQRDILLGSYRRTVE
jgi:hypothetical protein